MDMLSIENLIDIREAVTRRLQELTDVDVLGIPGAHSEVKRRKNSLSQVLPLIEERLKDLQFEADRELGHSPSDDVYRCDVCKWMGKASQLGKFDFLSEGGIDICPVCGDHNVQKI